MIIWSQWLLNSGVGMPRYKDAFAKLVKADQTMQEGLKSINVLPAKAEALWAKLDQQIVEYGKANRELERGFQALEQLTQGLERKLGRYQSDVSTAATLRWREFQAREMNQGTGADIKAARDFQSHFRPFLDELNKQGLWKNGSTTPPTKMRPHWQNVKKATEFAKVAHEKADVGPDLDKLHDLIVNLQRRTAKMNGAKADINATKLAIGTLLRPLQAAKIGGRKVDISNIDLLVKQAHADIGRAHQFDPALDTKRMSIYAISIPVVTIMPEHA